MLKQGLAARGKRAQALIVEPRDSGLHQEVKSICIPHTNTISSRQQDLNSVFTV